MKKNVIIVILVILVLVMGGYLVYDKVIDKDVEEESKEEIKNTIKNVSIVDAFKREIETEWPTEELEKGEGDPDYTIKSVTIPKIDLNTDNVKKLNNQIYNDYSKYVEMFDEGYSFDLADMSTDITVKYSYNIKDEIIYIVVSEERVCTRASSGTNFKGYYYDIINDKVLSQDVINNKLDIRISEIDDAEEILAVLPITENKYTVYYTDSNLGMGAKTTISR